MSLRSEVIRIFNELIGSSKKISDLPTLPSAVQNTDQFEVARSGTSYKATGSQLPSGGGAQDLDEVLTEGADLTTDDFIIEVGAGRNFTIKAGDIQLFFNEADGSIRVQDNRVGAEGLIYQADYSATFQARSLVDKAYVDAGTNTFNRQAASYTLVLSDAGKIVEMNVGSANNLTIPLNATVAFPIGTEILINQYGAGQTTIVATGGVTLRSKSGNLKIAAQYSGCVLIKVGTNEWYVQGDLTA